MSKLLVFTASRAMADELYEKIEPLFPGVAGVIHSNKEQNHRFNTVKQFKEGQYRFIIATDIVARGIDVAEVSHVINVAIVLCPPHLVPKWIREIEETIPAAKAMELSRIGRNADDPGDVNDVRRFLQLYKSGELAKKPVAVIAHTSAKYGAGWEHAVVRKRFVDDEDGRVFEALCCPTCGSPIQIDLPGGFVKVATTLDDLGDKRRFCEVEISGYELDEQKRLKRDEHGNRVWGKRYCGTPLFQFTGLAPRSAAACSTCVPTCR